MTSDRAVTDWIEHSAHPLTTIDPQASLDDLEPLATMIGEATVVGLARPTHGAHELSTLSHRTFRFLVERLGFRSLAIEDTLTNGRAIDAYVRTGSGDPRALIHRTAAHLRTEEFLDVVLWMRAHNVRHPSDPLRVVGVDIPDVDHAARKAVPDMNDVEAILARTTIQWRDYTGHKIVYWSGSHTAVGHARTVTFPPAPPGTGRNAGSYLREHFGPRYVSALLSFHQGMAPDPVPPPPAGRTDAMLGSTELAAYLLDLHADQPDQIRAWLHAPATMRLIGPTYNANDDANHHMTGGALADWFDLVIHHRQATPTHRIT